MENGNGIENVKVTLIEFPTEKDWMEVKKRALVTVGLSAKSAPDTDWKRKVLAARHSPVRRLFFSFYFEDLPTWVSVHLCRHVHAQPYVLSQRNDRQSNYDRNEAPQSAPVKMILDVNAEELIVMANKRLCNQASPETRYIVGRMCKLAGEAVPEIEPELIPMCARNGGVCYEIHPCNGRNRPWKQTLTE